MDKVRVGVLNFCLISWATASSLLAVREIRRVLYPALERASAYSLPSPSEAPVMTAQVLEGEPKERS